jgi:hypothetical protein
VLVLHCLDRRHGIGETLNGRRLAFLSVSGIGQVSRTRVAEHPAAALPYSFQVA